MPSVEDSRHLSAYAGPDVGGFGLLPQSAVPKLRPDPNLRLSWGCNLLRSRRRLRLQRHCRPASQMGRARDGGTTAAASTVAPRAERVPAKRLVDQALEDFRRLMQPISRRNDGEGAESGGPFRFRRHREAT